ncbi:MAG: hypothetical protein ACXWM8_05385 [Candidatus Limnocylindrales bacterium]
MTGFGVASDRRDGLGVLPRAFAVFMALHGIVHVIGFTRTWKLGGPKVVEYSTSLFNGSVDVGDLGIRLVGLAWLATAVAFVAAAVLLWRRYSLALQLTIALLFVSLGLCIASLPGSIYGLIIDVATLAALAVMAEKLVARPMTVR